MNYYLNLKTKVVHKSECQYVKWNARGEQFNENWVKFGSIDVLKKHCKKVGIKYKCCKKCMPKNK